MIPSLPFGLSQRDLEPRDVDAEFQRELDESDLEVDLERELCPTHTPSDEKQ